MNKKVLITGVTRGIGRATAVKFLENGYDLFGTYAKRKDLADELVQRYGSNRVTIMGPYDFEDINQISEFIVEAKNYTYDVIITNAGVFEDGDDFNDFSLDRFNKTMNCNFYSQLMIGTGLKDNIKSGGSIVLMSSNDAYSGAYSSISYSVSKAAVISLMKCLATNYGKKKVRVNALAPGAIDTDMNTPEQMIISPVFTPIGRAGKPEEVANAFFFLANENSSFINGVCLTVDGGYGVESVLLNSEANPPLSEVLQNYSKGLNHDN